MPQLTFSQALTANQLGYNPITGWQYEYLPFPAAVSIIVNATGVSARMTVYTGSQTIQQRAPVSSGGTAGVIPAPLNYQPISFVASAGDRLIMQIDEVAGATPTVNGVIMVEPL